MASDGETCWVCGKGRDRCGWCFTGVSVPTVDERGRRNLQMAVVHELCQPLANNRLRPICPLEGPKPYEALYGH